ncbi:MAG TPA: methyltransferase domain-containing protein [Acidimicrobiales bacterium]|nr:methyltransferase domain-containing protein [Acidimicrobiales bacterium]
MLGSNVAYDVIGWGYSAHRRPDRRIAVGIREALGPSRTVLNIGAGAGSYEPADLEVVAVEPSRSMIAQRPPAMGPCVQAAAEALPFPSDGFDAAMAIFTIHHWDRLALGLSEMNRVGVRRRVVLTWDQRVFEQEFWLVRDYLADLGRRQRASAVPVDHVAELIGAEVVVPVPVPHDCTDGFFGAYWRRPSLYLDQSVRSAISAFALAEVEHYREGLHRLDSDLRSGAWHRRYGDVLDMDQVDLGYRLVVAID